MGPNGCKTNISRVAELWKCIIFDYDNTSVLKFNEKFHQDLHCSHTQSMKVYDGSNQNLTLCLLVSSADNLCISLDPDQAHQNVKPGMDPNCLTLWWYSWHNCSKKLILKEKSADDKTTEQRFQVYNLNNSHLGGLIFLLLSITQAQITRNTRLGQIKFETIWI